MSAPHANRIAELAAETRAAAATIEHPWDQRALEWPLTAASVVVEVGGYKGRWALQIAERYHPRLYVFEPQPWACAVCRKVLGQFATVGCFGLGTTDGILPMGEWETDGCSFLKPGEQTGRLCEISAVFADLNLRHIDLLLMNIEGYEYTLLPHMLDKHIYPQRLMVQFHTVFDPTGEHLAAICGRLARLGYVPAWTYGPLLMAWERNA